MLKSLTLNKNNVASAFWFLRSLKISLSKKNILLSESSLNIINNNYFLTLRVFFRQRKIAAYSGKKKKKSRSFHITRLSVLFEKICILKKKFTNYLIINLNKKIKLFIIKDFVKVFKRFKQNLFPRRNDLYADFLNTSCLLVLKKIKINTYLLILGQIFTLLLKKKHGSFFFFKNFI